MNQSKRPTRLSLVLLLVMCLPAAAPAFSAVGDRTTTGTGGIRSIYDALHGVQLDTSASAKVENLVIQKDITKITLVSGRVFLARPWREGQKPTGAWFAGEGRIEMTPPNRIEKDQFKKSMDKEALDEKFTRAFIRFSDDFHDLLKDRIAPDAAGAGEAAKLFAERQKALEELNFNVEFPIISDYLGDGPRSPFFFFEFETPKHGWTSFFYRPNDLWESIYFKHKKVGFSDFQSASVITMFRTKEDYASGRDLGHDDKDTFWIRHYGGEIVVDKEGLLLKPKVDVEIESQTDNLKILTAAFMSYYGDENHSFKIDALTDADGKPLEYMHKNFQLLVALPKALRKGEKTTFHIEYTGDFIRPDPAVGDLPEGFDPARAASLEPLKTMNATFTLLNTYPWLPQSGFLKRFTLDWVVKVPTPFLAVASGVTEKRWTTDDGYNCLHTVEKTPVALASILFGRYIEKTDDSARPRVNVYTLAKQQKQADSMLAEARSVVTKYTELFGPFPYDELDIAQMGFFYGFGQAPPGLVQLTGEAFLSPGELSNIGANTSFIRGFVTHEIGHEWWGHAVSWANENDQWLSESYTEYCAGLYVQAVDGDKAFADILRSWRDASSRSKDSGPIWLGQRLGKHYINQTYNKGPYVLHMLRLALQAQSVANKGTVADGDKVFFESLRAFVEKFRNQNATTTDYQKILKQTAKVDMDWFFDQWFRGNGWLNLTFKYQVRPTEDGKYLLVATFRQPVKENVKQMIVPMYLHFGKEVLPKMVLLSREEQVVQMKLPKAPDKVSLDDNNDLLADIKYE